MGCNLLLFQGTIKHDGISMIRAYCCNLLLFQGTIKLELVNAVDDTSCNLLLFQGTIKHVFTVLSGTLL